MEYNDKFQKISSAPLNKRNCYKQPRRKSGDLFKKQGDYSEKKMVPFTSSLAIKSAPLKGLGLRLGTIIRTIASPVTFYHLRKCALRPTMIFETIRGTRLGDPLRGWCHRNTRVSDYNETVIPGDNPAAWATECLA